jgi:hypothetical protein
MFLVTSNKLKQLLHLSYIQRVKPEELRRGMEDLKALLADLSPGFHLLVDLSRLESMESDCAKEIGLTMEMFDRSGVALVVRVIPDPSKDIGMNILTAFHYTRRPRIVTCKHITEVADALSL